MIFKKCFILSGILISSLSFGGLALAKDEAIINHSNKNYLNMDTYITDSGEENNIYWTYGIEAPKMAKSALLNDPKNPTKEGYFYKTHEQIPGESFTRERYEYPIELNKGYYDLNKNFVDRYDTENPLCYLAAGANILLWWMDQNMDYINTYLNQLQTTDKYGQYFGLKKILPYDQKTWDIVMSRPEFSISNNNIQTELGLLKLVTHGLTKYYHKGFGGYPDRVWDLFINGYLFEGNIQNDIPINSEDNFKPDPTGGYFYPIFGKNIISERIYDTDYNYYKANLKQWFSEGKGVTLTYKGAKAGIYHAVTLWGVEYDEKGELIRVYITDSDDFDSNLKGIDQKNYSRGIHSAEIRTDEKGGMYITDITDPNKKGALVVGMNTLDLAQDIWEERLNDNKEISTPEIISESDDQVLPVNANASIEIKAKEPLKHEYITYQWFSATRVGGVGTKLGGKDQASLVLPTANIGDSYYYCEVSVNKGGKKNTIKSRYIKVTIDPEIPLIDTKAPTFSFNNSTITINQFGEYKISVKASSPDNGILSYQWYRTYANSIGAREKINGATEASFVVPTDNAGNYYYFPVITNTNLQATGIKSVSVEPNLAKRVVVKEVTIANLKPMNSLAITYDSLTYQPLSVKLRLGAQIPAKMLDMNKEYGMIVLASNDTNNLNALANINLDLLNKLKNQGFAMAINPVKVDNADYYQFSWVINNIKPENYGFSFSAYIYEINKETNEVRISQERLASVYSVRDIYLARKEELGLSSEIIKVLENI